MAIQNSKRSFTVFKQLSTVLYKIRASTSHCRYSSTCEEDEKKRREKLMSKGLPKKKEIEGVKNVILIASGKGGVGKTTTAVNVATSLANHHDLKVGLLDADVFGPCLPLMMNVNDTPFVDKEDKIIPLINYGVKCMSMGLLVPNESAIVWRGLMVMSALSKLTQKVQWGELDYLVIDTPPGTGDTLLSLVQNLYIAGVLLVTTPHLASIQVTRRGAMALKKMDVPIIGIVNNMNGMHCPNCNSNILINEEPMIKLSKELGIPILADIPVDVNISFGSDCGKPIVVSEPQGVMGQNYYNLTSKIIEHFQEKGAEDNIFRY